MGRLKSLSEWIIFLVITLYVVLLYSFNLANPDNPINLSYRTLFLPIKFTRFIFNLNKPGDLRYEFMRSTNPLVIEIDSHSDSQPSKEIAEWLAEMVKETTDRPVVVHQDVPDDHESILVNDPYLFTFAQKSADYSDSPSYLHLVYVHSYKEDDSYTGLVLRDNTLYVFMGAVKKLSETENIIKRLELSTIKHEWGHLLGANHLDQEDCIMSPRVDVYGNRKYQAKNIPTIYCPQTIDYLQKLKRTVQ